MKFSSKLLGALVLCGAVGTAAAQQLETNDAGGALLASIGTVTASSVTIPTAVNPTVGAEFCYGPNSLVNLRVTGAAAAPVILFLGELAATSTPLPSPSGEFFDLDLGGFLYVLADGFGGTGGLPLFDHTDNLGVTQYIFATHPGLTIDFAFQAVVADPAAAFGLNFTAAAPFHFDAPLPPFSTTGTAIIGDDTTTLINLANPVCMYGASFTQLRVCTNGWISFGGAETSTDFSDSVGEFTTGNPGSTTVFQTPFIAVSYDDLDLNNRASQGVAVEELAPGLVQVRYVDADRYVDGVLGNRLGDFTALIDSTTTTTTVSLSYALSDCGVFSTWTPLVGVSAGSAAATVTAVDLATAGVVNGTVATGGIVSLYEHFTVGGSVDLGGLTLNFTDAQGCFGDLFIF